MGNTSPLRRAMLEDDEETVRRILQNAGDGAPDLIDNDVTSDCFCNSARNIQSPLHTAMAKEKINTVKVLLEFGGDVNSPGLWGQQCLHLVARQNHVELCRLCVQHGADLHGEDNNGRRPLHAVATSHVAGRSGDLGALRYLMMETSAVEDLNQRDRDGNTPLHHAAFWGYPSTTGFLCENGADVTVKNNRGLTPIDVAFNREHSDTAQVIKEFLDQT